jgi:hypothetical protein
VKTRTPTTTPKAEGENYTTKPPTIAGDLIPGFDTAPIEGAELARLPKPGKRLYGLPRTTLLDMAERGDIRIVRLRKKGRARGIVLVCLVSLRAYLKSELEAAETRKEGAQ